MSVNSLQRVRSNFNYAVFWDRRLFCLWNAWKIPYPLYVLTVAFSESDLFILHIFCKSHLSLLPISWLPRIFELCPPQSPYITKTMQICIYFSINMLKGWPFNKYLILFAYFRLEGVWFSPVLSKYGFA